jgi:hypothetical protein
MPCVWQCCFSVNRRQNVSVWTRCDIATVGPAYLREASATLSRILASSGIIDEGFDHRYQNAAGQPGNIMRWPMCQPNGSPGVSDGDPPRCSVPQALRHAGMYCLMWPLAGRFLPDERVSGRLDAGDCNGMGDGSMQNESR